MSNLLNLLKKGSTLAEYDGGEPKPMDLSTKADRNFNKSKLDLDGKTPKQMNLNSTYKQDLLVSQLDLDGKQPAKYLDNPPR